MVSESTEHIVFKDRIDKATRLSYAVVKSMYDTPATFSLDGMLVVWHCKTLRNWKTILSASFKEGPLIEVTYNGEKEETYIDVYKKIESVRIPD